MFCIYIAVRSLDKNREFCKDVPYIYILLECVKFFFKEVLYYYELKV